MTLPLTLGVAWVIASALVAMLPMRLQYAPGLTLLLAAPVLIWMIGRAHGWLLTGFCVFAFLSMYRNPLIYLTKRALGLPVNPPPGREEGAE